MWHKRLIAAPVVRKFVHSDQNEFCNSIGTKADPNIVSIKARCGSTARGGLACSALREILCLERRQIGNAESKLVRYTETTIDPDSVSSLVWMTPKQAS